MIPVFPPDQFDITDPSDAAWYHLAGGDEQDESDDAEEASSSTARIAAAAAQAIEEAVRRKNGQARDAEDEWYQAEQDAMGEIWAANAAEEHHQPPDPEEVAAAAEEAIEQAMQRRADEFIGPTAPQFTPARSYQGTREGKVFKTGADGLGYYTDLGPVERLSLSDVLCPLLASPPIAIKLFGAVVGTIKEARECDSMVRAEETATGMGGKEMGLAVKG